MASSLLALIDDIATILDDVSVMTKVATKKTAGVLGDDLALNAQQVSGVKPDRELPVVWAVAKGSAVDKTILVPAVAMPCARSVSSSAASACWVSAPPRSAASSLSRAVTRLSNASRSSRNAIPTDTPDRAASPG